MARRLRHTDGFLSGGGDSPVSSTRKALWRPVEGLDGVFGLVNESGQLIVYGSQADLPTTDPEDLGQVYKQNGEIKGAENKWDTPWYENDVSTIWGAEKCVGSYINSSTIEFTLPAKNGMTSVEYEMNVDEGVPLTPEVDEVYG